MRFLESHCHSMQSSSSRLETVLPCSWALFSPYREILLCVTCRLVSQSINLPCFLIWGIMQWWQRRHSGPCILICYSTRPYSSCPRRLSLPGQYLLQAAKSKQTCSPSESQASYLQWQVTASKRNRMCNFYTACLQCAVERIKTWVEFW